MLLDAPAERQADRDFAADHPVPVLTYLANSIADGDRQFPYSTITAIDFPATAPQGPFVAQDGATIPPLGDGEIALNAWAAEDLGARLGDEIAVTYFAPESTHGTVREETVKLRLTAIVPLSGAGADRSLTPEVRGITDQKSIADWDPPFPFDSRRVRKKDEAYWDDYRTTPKAYVSLATGRRLWSSRFGRTTSLDISPPPGANLEEAAVHLAGQLNPAAMGLRFIPVKRFGLAASAGTTPFNLLFIGFSFFIVAAAMMLVALLFRLGIEQRAREIGILAAVGFARRRVAALLLSEGLLVAALGGALGVAGGLGYAALMLLGLRTWWLAAITTPFLDMYWTPGSLAAGFFSGAIVSLLSMAWSLRRLGRLPVRRLLAGRAEMPALGAPPRRRWASNVAVALAIVSLAAGFGAMRLGGEAQAGAFFGSGAAMLAACLTAWWSWLRRDKPAGPFAASKFPLLQLALRNGARHPTRSALTMGLMASACFLIVAVGAFRLNPASETGRLDSGSGGFRWIASSGQPIYADLNSAAARSELGFAPNDNRELRRHHDHFAPRAARRRRQLFESVSTDTAARLGIPPELIARGGFAWAGSLAESGAERRNPWLLLERPIENAPAASSPADRTAAPPVIPGVLDLNTALYSLHLYRGVGEIFEIRDGRDRPLRVQVVGLLQNSLFQGDLLLAEQALLDYFPDAAGYRRFLIAADSPPDAPDRAASGGRGTQCPRRTASRRSAKCSKTD